MYTIFLPLCTLSRALFIALASHLECVRFVAGTPLIFLPLARRRVSTPPLPLFLSLPTYRSISSVRTSMRHTATTAPTRKVCFQRVTAAEASHWSCGRSMRAAGRRMLSTRTLRRKPSNKWRRRRLLGRCKDFQHHWGWVIESVLRALGRLSAVSEISLGQALFPGRAAWPDLVGGRLRRTPYMIVLLFWGVWAAETGGDSTYVTTNHSASGNF